MAKSNLIPIIRDADVEIQRVADDVADRSKQLIEHCPAPKRADIHKLMALQAHMLNEHGMIFLTLARSDGKNRKAYLDQGVKLMKESRATFSDLLKDDSFDVTGALLPAVDVDIDGG